MSEKRKEWASRIKAWEAGGETQASYCRKHGLSQATFKYWRSKLEASQSVKRDEFVRVGSSEVVELVYGGATLRFPVTTPASWVAEVLQCFSK